MTCLNSEISLKLFNVTYIINYEIFIGLNIYLLNINDHYTQSQSFPLHFSWNMNRTFRHGNFISTEI